MAEIHVHKFGGSSLTDASSILKVAEIVTQQSGRRLIVVSALSGVTDTLSELAKQAAKNEAKTLDSSDLQSLVEKHTTILRELGTDEELLAQEIQRESEELGNLLTASRVSRSTDHMDLISSFGEPWSARLLVAALKKNGVPCTWLNARKFLVVRNGEMGPEILWKESAEKLQPLLQRPDEDVIVITGYLASTPENQPTTLKRNGSDWTASIVANITEAKSLTVWKDVAGVMSADPRVVKDAFVLNELSYHEAAELAYFGAKVLHPKTIQPAKEKDIPIYIKSTFSPEKRGTSIVSAPQKSSLAVKGFTTLKDISLLNIEGNGMVGIPGTARRVFDSLRESKISVIMISQSGSEQSICLAIRAQDGERSKQILEQCFFSEVHHGLIDRIELEPSCSIIAVVGDGMITQPGVAAKFCGALASVGVSIKAIAQGSSERNISLVVAEKDRDRAIRAAHSSFYLSHTTVNIGLLGPGQIGQELLSQIDRQRDELREQLAIDFRIKSIANSSRMLCAPSNDEINPHGPHPLETPLDIETFTQSITDDRSPFGVIVDCTASQDVANRYPGWFHSGYHIVTPNKKANSSDWESYQRLHRYRALHQNNPKIDVTSQRDSQRDNQRSRHKIQYYYESTVGAGLPVISTLQDLIHTGDQILSIRGIFSGTLSYIFNEYQGSPTFSEIVRTAKEQGFTEPDPRDDLSGLDVARKLVILGRECGLSIELDHIQLESLVPEDVAHLSIDEYLKALPNYDSQMLERYNQAQQNKRKLAYVASLDVQAGAATVGLESIDPKSSLANVSGSDNIIEFRTRRYDERPLVIKGPGAGPAVTAAGVFSDLLRLAQRLQRGIH